MDKILVIKLGALGDFIQALGAMKAIRAHHDDAHITLLTTAPYQSIGQDCGYFDDMILDSKPKWYQPHLWAGLRLRLNTGGFNRVYDLQNNDRTSLYLKLFSHKPEWVGAAAGASHRNTSPERAKGHAFDSHVQTLALAGIEPFDIDTLSWMNGDLSRFDLPKRYVLIASGCSPKHPQKRWPPAEYAALGRALSKHGMTPVLIGTRDDADAVEFIKEHCQGAIDLSEKTSLYDLPALARGAAFSVGNDTGPIHIIAATGCLTFALYSGFSHPVKHRPLGAHVQIIRQEDLQDLDYKTVLNAILKRLVL